MMVDVDRTTAQVMRPYVKQFVLDSAEYIDGDMDVQWLVMVSEYISGKPNQGI